jgi:hypothetical protein
VKRSDKPAQPGHMTAGGPLLLYSGDPDRARRAMEKARRNKATKRMFDSIKPPVLNWGCK